METQNPHPEVLAKIKDKIKKEIPRSRNYARLLSGLKMGSLIALIIVAVLTLSLFLSDIMEKFQGGEFEDRSFLQNIPGFVFGFLTVSFMALIVIYVIYRHTDWPFVKNKVGIFIGAFIFIVLLSGATVYISEKEKTALGDFLDGTKDRVEEALHLKSWLDSDDGEQIGHIEGVITSIEPDGRDWIIVVEAEKEKQELTLEHRFGEFTIADQVQIEYEIDGDQRDVEAIKKI